MNPTVSLVCTWADSTRAGTEAFSAWAGDGEWDGWTKDYDDWQFDGFRIIA